MPCRKFHCQQSITSRWLEGVGHANRKKKNEMEGLETHVNEALKGGNVGILAVDNSGHYVASFQLLGA